MIDIVDAHVFIIGLLPAKRKFVPDTIRESLWFCKPVIKIRKGKERISLMYN